MNPQSPAPQMPYDPHQHVDNTLSVTQAGERTICEVKRHPIGIFGIYFMSGMLLIIIAVLAFGVVPHLDSSISSSQADKFGALLLLIAGVVAGLYSLAATKVYWGNTWVLTSD